MLFRSVVVFGDGTEGAKLPTGQNNIQGGYHSGSDPAGNVGAGVPTTPKDRPLGVSIITNLERPAKKKDRRSSPTVKAKLAASAKARWAKAKLEGKKGL